MKNEDRIEKSLQHWMGRAEHSIVNAEEGIKYLRELMQEYRNGEHTTATFLHLYTQKVNQMQTQLLNGIALCGNANLVHSYARPNPNHVQIKHAIEWKQS